jgi:hypothetical protein
MKKEFQDLKLRNFKKNALKKIAPDKNNITI